MTLNFDIVGLQGRLTVRLANLGDDGRPEPTLKNRETAVSVSSLGCCVGLSSAVVGCSRWREKIVLNFAVFAVLGILPAAIARLTSFILKLLASIRLRKLV